MRAAGMMMRFAIWIAIAAASATANGQERLELVDSANYYIKENRLPDAERCLKSALRMEPGSRQNALLLSNLGLVQAGLGKWDEALESYSVGLNISPSSTVLLTNRGGLFLEMNRPEECIADLTRALEIDSTLTRPRLLRATCNMMREDFKGAEKDLNVLVCDTTKDDVLLAMLAQCKEISGNRQGAEALIERAIKASPSPRYYYDLGRMLILDEDFDKSRSIVNEGIDKYPDSGELYLLRGYIHRKRFLPAEAQADREIALRKGVDERLVDAWIPKK